jgi:hypothetical protein
MVKLVTSKNRWCPTDEEEEKIEARSAKLRAKEKTPRNLREGN